MKKRTLAKLPFGSRLTAKETADWLKGIPPPKGWQKRKAPKRGFYLKGCA